MPYDKNSVREYSIAVRHKDHTTTQTLFTVQGLSTLEQLVANRFIKGPKNNYVLIGVKPTIPLLEEH